MVTQFTIKQVAPNGDHISKYHDSGIALRFNWSFWVCFNVKFCHRRHGGERLSKTAKIPGKILLAIGAGFCFPVCDCGVIPVVRRMLVKKVPPYMAIAFLVTAPLVNPITVWATATAFGYNLPITLIRVGMAITVGFMVALAVSKVFPSIEHLFSAKAMQELQIAAANDVNISIKSGEFSFPSAPRFGFSRYI